MPLRLVSYLAPGVPERLFAVLADHLSVWLDDSIDLVLDASRSGPSPGEERIFRHGGVDLAFVCSTSYVWMRDRATIPAVRLAGAAWVPTDPRSGGRPVFHADVVTGADRVRSLTDLAGREVAYNDEASLSGYLGLRIALRAAGLGPNDVRFVRSGSHVASLAWVRSGEVAAAAIDANVLRRLRRLQPDDDLRTVEVLGPFPSQPLVVREGLGPALLARLRVALLRASATPEVAAELREAELRGFAPVIDRSYDDLREAMRTLSSAGARA